MSRKVQAVLFSKEIYDTHSARRWLRRHNYTPIKRVHETTRFLRYRIREPDYNNYEYTTKYITTGIKMIIGFPIYS